MTKKCVLLSLAVLSLSTGCDKYRAQNKATLQKVQIRVRSAQGDCDVDRKSVTLDVTNNYPPDVVLWCIHGEHTKYQIHFTAGNPFDTSGANNPIDATKNHINGDDCSDVQLPTNGPNDYPYQILYTDNGNQVACSDPHVILK